DDDVSSLIVAMATVKPAETTTKATEQKEDAQNAPESSELSRGEQLPDPGVPPAFSSKHPPKPPRKHYVCDYADLLTSSDRSRIETLGRALDNACGAEIVIVTVPTRGEEAVGQYALSVAKDWGIGKKGDDNGCIFFAVRDNLLARKSGKISIKTGYGLECCLPDAKCGRILDDIALPPFAGAYDKAACSAGLRKAYEALVSEVATEFKAELNLGEIHRLTPKAKRKQPFFKRFELYVKVYALIAIICLVVYFPLGALLLVLPFFFMFLPSKSGRAFLWEVLTFKTGKFKYGSSGGSGDSSYDDDSSYDSSDDDDDDDDYGGGDFGGGVAD
ncbi:MAG: TPM domain-containing protein, partial [Victivallales bacterium]|nr:TPM domain-containing protein [Victivallales bacterium]